jgi:signal transduction histidine kinase
VTRPTVSIERDRSELFAVTSYTVITGIFSYLSFIPLFVAIGAPSIAAINLGIVALLVVALVLVRRGKVFGGMVLASCLVIGHAWLTTLTLGWDFAFQLHIVLALELGLLFTTVSVRTRLVFAAGVVLAYLGLMQLAGELEPAIELGPQWQRAFALLNSAIFLAVTVGIASYYAWMVQRNRRSRDRAYGKLEGRNEQLRASEEALGLARDRAEAGSRAKSMFLANMSHELRTPLNAIIGYSELIAEDAEDAGQPQLVEEVQKIRGAGRHLLSLINDVLDLSKIEAGHMEYERLEMSIADSVREVADTVRALAEEKGNRLVVEVEEGLPSLRSDPTKIRQILLNLLSNANKFTSEGELGIEVCSSELGDRVGVQVTVRDTGIGIPAESLEQIFVEFAQANETTTRRFGGTGLGLAITHRFCEALGGSISVDSKVGRGSVFRVWLPREAPEAPRRRDA